MTEQPFSDFSHDSSVADFAVSKRAYLDARPEAPFEYVATSTLVLDTRNPSEPRILLLQRAASDSNPSKWEPPGGACDNDDLSILHAAARELWEEAGLRAVWIGGPVADPHFFIRSNGGKVCRFNFAVQVSIGGGTELIVKLDPKEHQNFVWATEDEVKARKVDSIDLLFTRDEVRCTVLSAFDYWKANEA